jgi:monoamine oxidase
MTSLPSSVDVAIIGAGAAGLGAAHALAGSGLSVIVLEARDRLGGRAWTVQASPEVTFDVGCGWLHSAANNSFVAIAKQLGFEVNKDLPPWRERAYGNAFPKAERDDFMHAMDAFYQRLWKTAQNGKDVPASLSLEPGNRWNAMIDAISTYINGCELKDMSTLDWDAYEDSDLNWRVRRGYGALIAAYGAPCPVALNCNVTLIDHSDKRIRIETSQGTLTADKVIVTVPTNLIANEAIRFSPALRAKVDAAAGLPLGVDDKVTLALENAEALPKEGNSRRHHAHRHGHLSYPPVRPALHRRLFRRQLCARTGRRRRRRSCSAKHRRDRRLTRQRHQAKAEAALRVALGA